MTIPIELAPVEQSEQPIRALLEAAGKSTEIAPSMETGSH